ncbi:MAG: NYN domain-containing protein [Chloroflexi bacterium]|jgi:uncharacterized LabA/DUF88 family protein|nr:NYN domain-containing protein [Chloroflexota bacterium]
MKFNTAILYDIENLIGGYSQTDYLSSLSLRDVFDDIVQKDIDGIAIQRAYANWGDHRLNILRGDIVELGIEPVQMFGFGRGPTKNASDIQLAIDAIDIAFTRPAVEKFVIVSGDGAFSALAKKLHEYGKMVIGCAYRKTVNRVFEAVCDDFIWVNEPRDDDQYVADAKNVFNNPILSALAKKYRPVEVEKSEDVFDQARQIIHFFETYKDASYLLKNVGMNISIYSQALSYRIEDFNYIRFGFVRFTDFIRYVAHDTNVKLVFNPPSEYRLLMKESTLHGFETIEPLRELSEIHTLDTYKELLAKGRPVFRLPSVDVVFQVAQFISDHKMELTEVPIGDIIDLVSSSLEYEQKDIREVVLSLVSADCFVRKPEDVRLSEQTFSFRYDTPLDALRALRESMHDKLESILGDVEDEVFDEVIELNV